MASEIVGFVSTYWQDILIAAFFGIGLLAVDYFFLRKRRGDEKTSSSLAQTDRLIMFLVFFLVIAAYLGISTMYLFPLIVGISFLIGQRVRFAK